MDEHPCYVCGTLTSTGCQDCGNVYYCSAEHAAEVRLPSLKKLKRKKVQSDGRIDRDINSNVSLATFRGSLNNGSARLVLILIYPLSSLKHQFKSLIQHIFQPNLLSLTLPILRILIIRRMLPRMRLALAEVVVVVVEEEQGMDMDTGAENGCTIRSTQCLYPPRMKGGLGRGR